MNLAIMLSGRGSNFRAIHEAIVSDRIRNTDIVCVLSDKADAPGLKYAEDNGLNTIFVDPKQFKNREEYDREVIRRLAAHHIDLLCLAGYMRILSGFFTDEYHGRLINIHPSLLPAFPGLHAQKQAVDYGVKVAGCTVHFVDSGMDTGPIIAQQYVRVMDDDTEDTLSARILEQEHILYPHTVGLFAEGRVRLYGKRVWITG